MSDNQQSNIQQTTTSTDEVVVTLYKSADKIYARSISGTFNNWRWVMVWATQLFFYGVPWLEWGNRQAMLFDLDTRRFYIFGLVFNPQDLIYLTFLLIISALSLFLFTAIAGRLWCGYTCPQTVYTEIFMWFESKIEGDRNARMRLDKGFFSGEKLLRKAAKHAVWIVFALWTGFTFVGYFTPIRELAEHFVHWTLGPWETFWVFFYGFATYGNAGFMREQVCKYMCPYARFQSAMFDDDTLIVTYDEVRGEPRGARSKKLSEHTEGLGSCVDCGFCVQVCPTGIDIRKGLQYECIGCGLCVDACDQVMDKMQYERGLIKYSTANGMQNRWSKQQMWRRVLRPRVMIYSSLLILLVVGFLISLYFKPTFRVDISRDRAVISRLSDDGKLENVYRLKLANNAEHPQRFLISASGLESLSMEIEEMSGHLEGKASHEVTLNSEETLNVILDLKTPDGVQKAGSHQVDFTVKSLDSNEVVVEKSVFIVAN